MNVGWIIEADVWSLFVSSPKRSIYTASSVHFHPPPPFCHWNPKRTWHSKTKCLYDWVHTSYNNKITRASYRWKSLIMPGENMEFKNRKGILFVLFGIYNLSKFIRPGNLQCFWLDSGYKHWLASHCRRTTTWLGPKCRTPTPYSSTFSPYSHEWDISQANRLIKSVGSRTNKSTRSSTKTLLSKWIEAEDEN